MKPRPDEVSRGLSDERGPFPSREVRIVQKGPLWIAVPVEEGPALDKATVDAVLRKLRGRDLS